MGHPVMTVIDPQKEHIAKLERELAWARLKIQALIEELRAERIAKYGPKSETLSNLQLELLDQEPGVTREEVEAEARREAIPERPPRERKPHPGRKPLPDTLPRVEEVIVCEANCKRCGGETKIIGYDASEVLDREPAKWFVRVTKREKRSCEICSSIAMPPLAARIVDKGLASDRVVVDTVVAKYSDHLPLYRQEAMLEREAGVEISRATLDGWVMRVGELLGPIAEAMRADLLRSSYLQADETTVPVQMHDKCQGRSKTRPLGRRESGPLHRQERPWFEGFTGAAGA
jgi:transposase